METLKRLYRIYSPSGYEDRMSDYIQGHLEGLNVKFKVWDRMIYWINPGTPLVCAHMDHVADFPQSRIKEKNGILYGTGNLGADDKNGIWIALKLIEQYRQGISFIFSTGEEAGGDLEDGLLYHLEPALDKVLYGLLFDRMGAGDIICNHNLYGTMAFEKQLSLIGKRYGYKPARGIWSDADALSWYISCANLSCGYHMAHTSREYTVIRELENALAYGMTIIKQLRKRFKPLPYIPRTYKKTSWTYNGMGGTTPGKADTGTGTGTGKKAGTGKKKKKKGTGNKTATGKGAEIPGWADADGWGDTAYYMDRADDPACIMYFCPDCNKYFESADFDPGITCPYCYCRLLLDDYPHNPAGDGSL